MRPNRLRPFTLGAIRRYLCNSQEVSTWVKIVGTESVSGDVVVDVSRSPTSGVFNDEPRDIRYRCTQTLRAGNVAMCVAARWSCGSRFGNPTNSWPAD
ncbi:Uncharacterised protein [Mycobacteroides abscessus subsp. abscessus]|nr:Uncharacterised protein [Mycobacteroides abscessus subsp. abscessus]